MQGFAWDAAGERLAVALDGAQQRVAVFATAYEPIMTLRFLGSIPLSPGLIHISHQQRQLAFKFLAADTLAALIQLNVNSVNTLMIAFWLCM